MSVTRQHLVHDLRSIGLQAGDVVLFHSSLSSLGHVEGGAQTVVDAFLEVVGPDGTVATPNIIHTSGLPRPPFDLDQSPSEVGAITEDLRKRPNAVRSLHPTHSVAAIGRRAEELVAGHSKATGVWTPWGKAAFGTGSPWDLLYQWDAHCLFLGVTFRVCTLFHYVQAQYLNKHQPDYAEAIPFPYFSHDKMGELLKKQLQLHALRVGGAESWLARARDIVDRTARVLENDPLSLAQEKEPSSFMAWAANKRGRSLTLNGGMGRAPLEIAGVSITGEGTSLAVRALILQCRDEMFALVSLTLIGLNAPCNLSLQKMASQQTGIPIDRIMIACTHVHSGPSILTCDEGATGLFMKAIEQSMSEALAKAKASMKPVRLAVASRPLEGLTRIRRALMSDGHVYTIRRAVPSTWRCQQKPEYVGVDGELDIELTVVRIEDASGEPLGSVFHFTTHPIPDLHGYAADWMEKNMAGNFVCLPLNGALGDVDTVFDQPFNGKFAEDQLPSMGQVLSGAVMELLARAPAQDGGETKVLSAPLELKVDPFVAENRHNDPVAWIATVARRQTFTTRMIAVKLGGLALVGLPGELACSIGLSIKKESPFQHTCPVALANDEVGYLMTEASRRLGGYEADASQWALTATGSAETIRQAAMELLEHL